MNEIKNYYASELEKVAYLPPRARKIQITSGDKKTNWLSLNDESATELVKFLSDNYNIKYLQP